MARVEYNRHKRVAVQADDGVSDVQPQRDWNGDAHEQKGITGFDGTASTLSSDAFVLSDALHIITGEGAAPDNLVTITSTDALTHDEVRLKAAAGQTITVKNTGNLRTLSATDKILSTTVEIKFQYDGTNWYEVGPVNAVLTDKINTYGDFAQLFRSGKVEIRNPANTFSYFLVAAAIAANRNVNLPLLTADDTIAVLAEAQTFLTGAKTFNSSILKIRNPADTFSYTLVASAIAAARNLTIPLLTADDVMAVLGIAQTFTQPQTFKNTRNTVTAITYAATTDLDFDLEEVQTLSLTGNVTFTTSNRGSGRHKTIKILADATIRTLTFPAWKFVGTKPTQIAASKTAILTISGFGSADTDIVAAYAEEA